MGIQTDQVCILILCVRMILFFDIDGTLIDEKSHVMPESASGAIEAARRNGHICAVNTGRTGKLVEPDRKRLAGFDAFIMGCGTMITLYGKVLYHRTFSEREARDIIEALDRFGIDAVLEGYENNFCDRPDRIRTETFRKFISRFADAGYGSFEDAAGHFDKFYAYADSADAVRAFAEEFGDRLDFVDRKKGFFEIMPKGCSKAIAMKRLAEELDIPMEQTAALGDSSNDIPMLQCAGIGIAMGNATADVKEAADYITDPLGEDGVRNALKRLGVI